MTKKLLLSITIVLGLYILTTTYIDIREIELERSKISLERIRLSNLEHKCSSSPKEALLHHSDANKTLAEVYKDLYNDSNLLEGFDPYGASNTASKTNFINDYTDLGSYYVDDEITHQIKNSFEELLPKKNLQSIYGSSLDHARFKDSSKTYKIDNYLYKNENVSNGGTFFKNVGPYDSLCEVYPCY